MAKFKSKGYACVGKGKGGIASFSRSVKANDTDQVIPFWKSMLCFEKKEDAQAAAEVYNLDVVEVEMFYERK